MNPIILIAEDHSVVRLGAIIMLEEIYTNVTVHEVTSFEEIISNLKQTAYDLLILDIHIPGGDNLKMIELIKMKQPGIRILMFSSYDESIFALSYINAGALGYLQKDASKEVFKMAIKKVLNNERFISNKMQQTLFRGWLDNIDSGTNGIMNLSHREIEIANLLIKGHRTNEIKEILNIQASTISTHKERIFSKMDVTNVIQLAQKFGLRMTKFDD